MTRRAIRWVEGFKGGSQPIYWGQKKEVEIAGREAPVTRPSDRNTNFQERVPNPDFVPREQRQAGTRYTAAQLREFNTQPRFTDEEKNVIQAEAEGVIAAIQNIADGEVTRFFYSAEANELRYTQVIDVDGEPVTEEKTTDDETLLEVASEFTYFLSQAVQREGKPLEVAGPPESR